MDNLKVLQKQIPIRRHYPENLITQFSDNVTAQFAPGGPDPDHFIVAFFQLRHPQIFEGSDEEVKRSLDAIEFIESECVARIILTPQKMRDLVKVLKANLDQFDAVKKARK